MRRYYFHVQDGQYMPDHVGTELPSQAEVRRHAIELAGRILADHYEPTREIIEWQITVLDDSGETVFTLNFYGDTPQAPSASQ